MFFFLVFFYRKSLLLEPSAHGVSSSQIVFSEHVKDRSEYLRNMYAVDVALDTPVYSSGSIAVEVNTLRHIKHIIECLMYAWCMQTGDAPRNSDDSVCRQL